MKELRVCGFWKSDIIWEQQKVIALVQKETSPKELFQYLIELLDTYPITSSLPSGKESSLLFVSMIIQRAMPAGDKTKYNPSILMSTKLAFISL